MTNPQIPTSKFELRAKLVEGLLTGLALILLELFVFLLIRPVQAVFLQPGLFVYAVILLAASFISLEHGLDIKDNNPSQALWGVVGGVVAWIFLEFSSWLSGQTIASLSAFFYFIFSLLVAWVLWRRIALIGLRYYILTILLGWGGHLALAAIKPMVSFDPNLAFLPSLTGYLAVIAGSLGVTALFTRSRNRLQCLNAALVIWAAFTAAIYVLQFKLG